MKQRKICVISQFVKWGCIESVRYFLSFDERKYGLLFVWDEKEPDYLIVDNSIYNDYFRKSLYQKYLKLATLDTVSILFTFECFEPDLNLFDYALVWDADLIHTDRICKVPISIRHKSLFEMGREKDAVSILKSKNKYCNFIYSNPWAPAIRTDLFYKLSEYKQVDSLGPYLRNVEINTDPYEKDAIQNSIILKKPYKFSIACENGNHNGYISEKIITSFLANTIPIYWGDPKIAEVFNPKAFINYYDYDSLEEVLETVKKIDQSDELWCQMVNEPWFTEEQITKQRVEKQHYNNFLINIFSQDPREAKRLSNTFWIKYYKKMFLEDKFSSYNTMHYQMKNIVHLIYSMMPLKIRNIILKYKK